MMQVPLTPKRILVVDDDDVTRAVTTALARANGYDVETASDGIEALAKVHLGVDLVLLDVVMPGMDGFEVCRRNPHGGRGPRPAGDHADVDGQPRRSTEGGRSRRQRLHRQAGRRDGIPDPRRLAAQVEKERRTR